MPRSKKWSIALDVEATGLDIYHIARPFLVTTFDSDNNSYFWEWDVNPLTREPIIPESDKDEIQEQLERADVIVGQNFKIDIQYLESIGIEYPEKYYAKTHDTLFQAHLIASAEKHDLNVLAMKNLRVDITPLENAIEKATKEARAIARREFKDWKISKFGLPGMPSVKKSAKETEDKIWKGDMWLPRAIAKAKKYPQGIKGIANIFKKEPFDIYIGRPKGNQPWCFGNPFVIGPDGNRETVIQKFEKWLATGESYRNKDATKERRAWILQNLKQLDGKVVGCFCAPDACHGEVYKNLLPAHPWWTVAREYATTDTIVTLPVYEVQRDEIIEAGLTRVYEERRSLIEIIVGMEKNGVSGSIDRMQELKGEYQEESKEFTAVCMGLAEGKLDKLPKTGTSKGMRKLLFEDWGVPVYKSSETTGEPGLDKEAVEYYLKTLDPHDEATCFIRNLAAKRKRDTALSYIESYERFGIAIHGNGFLLHPFLNPTGQRTLRWSSKNPSEQVISKQFFDDIIEDRDESGKSRYEREGKNLRYFFGPGPGREWWSLDYVNIELMIPAYKAEEEAMIALFERPNDPPYFGSYHLLNSHILYPEEFEHALDMGWDFKKRYKATYYQWAKNTGFARQYNAQKKKIDATAHKDGAFELLGAGLPKVTAMNDYYVEFAQEHGFVWTVDDKENGPYPIQCEPSWGNRVSPTIPFARHIQSSAARCLAKAMKRVNDYLKTLQGKHYITINLHDELVLDFPKGKTPMENLYKIKHIEKLMAKSGDDIGVPLRVSSSYHPVCWAIEDDIKEAA